MNPQDPNLAKVELISYLADRCAALLAMPDFMNCLPGMVFQDETLPERVATVAARLQQLARLDQP